MGAKWEVNETFVDYYMAAEGNGNPLQHSCLESTMGRGTWQDTVHGVAKNWTRLSNTHMQFIIIISGLCIYNGNIFFVCTWFRRKYQTRNEWFVFKPQFCYSVRYFTSLLLQHPYTSTSIKSKLVEISGFETSLSGASVYFIEISQGLQRDGVWGDYNSSIFSWLIC